MTYQPKGYATAPDVQAHLGQQFTPDQVTYATQLIAFAESYIDRETRRSWLSPVITSERYDLVEPRLYLKQRPVASVSSIVVRSTQVGDTGQTLTQGTDYELIDANRGEVRFVSGYGDQEDGYIDPDAADWFTGNDEPPSRIALVTYTPTGPPVPADIWRAATLIAASSMALSLWPDRYGLIRADVGDVRLMYGADAVTLQVPQAAQDIIDGYVLPLIV